jgi:hypothetical protein
VKPRANSAAWWEAHGISPEVRDARRYVRWTRTRNREEPIAEAYAGLEPAQMKTLRGWASQAAGLIMYRHSWQGNLDRANLHFLYPEVRPDTAVRTRPGEKAKYLFAPAPKFDKGWWHLGEREGPLEERAAYRDYLDALEVELEDPGTLPSISSPAERVAVSKKRPVVTHAETFLSENGKLNRARQEEHVREDHKDGRWFGDLDGPHYHLRRTPMKQTVLAKRLDLNPIMRDRLQETEPEWWLFGIEGCLKSDAMLTAVLRQGLNVGVFSVPSVSLWAATYPTERLEDLEDGSELRDFTRRHLVGKEVWIIPDADGFEKQAVMTQALLARAFLRHLGLGVRAYVAAPPPWQEMPESTRGRRRRDPETGELKFPKQGVDDFLGLHGGDLLDLYVYDLEPRPREEIRAWLLARKSDWTQPVLERAVDTVEALSLCTAIPKDDPGHAGGYYGSLAALSRASGVSRWRLSKAIQEDLKPLGAVGPPELDLSRVGGDEFAVIATTDGRAAALQMCSRLSRASTGAVTTSPMTRRLAPRVSSL